MDIAQFAESSAKITHIYKVTEDVYRSFQRCSNDFNPLHTDAAFARQKGFDQPVMYGNILNAFISHFVGMLLPTRDVMIQSQDISFHKPVFMNDEIRLEAAVDSVSEAVNVIIYKLKFYRIGQPKDTLVAKAHVQIGLI